MTATKTTYPIILADGSELFVNRCGTGSRALWIVDIFPIFYKDDTPVCKGETVEPDYHAAYSSESEALSDAASWRTWDQETEALRARVP